MSLRDFYKLTLRTLSQNCVVFAEWEDEAQRRVVAKATARSCNDVIVFRKIHPKGARIGIVLLRWKASDVASATPKSFRLA